MKIHARNNATGRAFCGARESISRSAYLDTPVRLLCDRCAASVALELDAERAVRQAPAAAAASVFS